MSTPSFTQRRRLHADLRHGEPPADVLRLVLHHQGTDLLYSQALLPQEVCHLVRDVLHVLKAQAPVLEDREGLVREACQGLLPLVRDGIASLKDLLAI